LRELHRVLRPGGTLLVIEFFRPTSKAMGFVFGQLFRRAMPLIGRVVSGHAFAYSYLPESVGAFVTRAEFVTMLNDAGFDGAQSRNLDGGIASIVVAVKSSIGNRQSSI
jgi:demethylmenaquinone methyltransferase/2-methoxy-6-polyprenyl-1,4-benzoquinol methylase